MLLIVFLITLNGGYFLQMFLQIGIKIIFLQVLNLLTFTGISVDSFLIKYGVMKNIQLLKMLKRSAAFLLLFLFLIIISQAQNTRISYTPQVSTVNFLPGDMSLNIYPNPAADEAKLTFNSSFNNDSYEIRILNNSGMILKNIEGTTVQGQNTITIHVGDYTPGIYYLQLITRSGVRQALKFVKLPVQ